MLFQIKRRLTTDTGRINKQAAREQIAYEIATHRISVREAARRTRNSLICEIKHIEQVEAENKFFAQQEHYLNERARIVGDFWKWDLERLQFERNRYFWSCSTAREDLLPVLERAVTLARAKQTQAAA